MVGMAGREKRRGGEAIRITTAAPGRDEDTAGRQRRYLISMAVRTLCVVGASVVAMTLGTDWLFWLLVTGAVLLPYVAVVAANAVSRATEGPPLPGVADDLRNLGGPDSRGGTRDGSLS
jgi:hypothetical protein